MPGVPVVGDVLSQTLGYDAMGTAARDAAGLQYQASQQARKDLAPWRNVGQDALAMLDLGPLDMSGWETDPGYQFRMDQGLQGIERMAGTGRSPYGSAALKAMMGYGQNLASQEYGNIYNRRAGDRSFLFNVANMGMGAAGGQADYGLQGANAQASGMMGEANARNAMWRDLLGAGAQATGAYFGSGGGR